MHFGPSLRHVLQLSLAFAALLGPAEAARAEARAPASAKPTQINFTVPSSGAPEGTLGGNSAHTRFLIGLDHSVEFQVFSLSSPNRVVVDLPEIALKLPNDPGGESVGLVRSFRAGMSAPGKARIVIDVTQPVVVESAKVVPSADGKSQHLALEIVPVEAVSKTAKKPFRTAPYSLGAAGLQPPLPLPAMRPDIRAAKAFKPVIVIDPGHGGHDSGATKNGAVEKDVVLAFSKVFREKLEKTGHYKVLLTRDKDVFVELGDRVSFGERNKANLFIAVHADYSDDNSRARGATIYSLRESVAKALERSAKGEVSENVLSSTEVEKVKKASVGDFPAVKKILADLAGRDLDLTKERTSIFSRSVIEFMGTSTGLRNEPDQQAGFRVLKTAQFPSVLIELAYVTNKEDAALLQSDAWRDKVADSIVTAVESYFSSQIAQLPM